MANEPTDFGGHKLADVVNLTPAAIGGLRQLGFIDVEQVQGALGVPGIAERLSGELGLSTVQLDDLMSKLNDVVPTIAAGETEGFALGALAPTPEIEAMGAAADVPQIAAELPSSINHIAALSTPRSQGERGTCVSFAMTAVHEYFHRVTSKVALDYSEQFLYHETKLIDGQPNICGTWQVKAAQVLGNLGQCPRPVWPYNGSLPCNDNGIEPSTARIEAAKHKLATVVLAPKNVVAIKSALAAGCVVGFSIPVYNSWYKSQETARTGRITMRIGNEPSAGGHAMCLVGYQDEATMPGGGFFVLRNSWFGAWGTQCLYGSGNGTIPYAYLANENWEAVTTPPPEPPVA